MTLDWGEFPPSASPVHAEKALDNRSTIADGRDPRTERRRSAVPPFKDAAVKYIKQNAARWRHDKTAINWAGCLSQYAYPVFGDMRIDRIERSDVLAVLDPVWTTKPAIARKLRQRIRAVFADAMARGHIEINPAGELINAALQPMPAVKSHFRALPYQDVAQALATIEESAASRTAKLCLRFLVLTAARSGGSSGRDMGRNRHELQDMDNSGEQNEGRTGASGPTEHSGWSRVARGMADT